MYLFSLDLSLCVCVLIMLLFCLFVCLFVCLFYCLSVEFPIDESTGLKVYPFKFQSIPRLHWEDPEADHLMTHDVGPGGGGAVM